MLSATLQGKLITVMAHRSQLIGEDRYSDSEYEYRHVQLPKAMLKVIPRDYFDTAKGTLKLLWEEEWRGLGITQVRRCRGSRCTKPDLTHRAWDGNTMKYMSLSRTFSCLSETNTPFRRTH